MNENQNINIIIDDSSVFIKPNGKKTNRRRSSFFQRRLSSKSSDFTSLTNFENISNDDDEQQMIQYKNKLIREKEDWKKNYQRLKNETSELKEKCTQVVDHASRCELLTQEDGLFLQERPDYKAIGCLLDSTMCAVAIKQRRIISLIDKLYTFANDVSESSKVITESIISQVLEGFNEFDLQIEQFLKDGN